MRYGRKPQEIRATEAFTRARWKATLRQIWSQLHGHTKNRLLAYEEVKKKAGAGAPTYKGMQSVPLDKIVGSVNRYEDFDRAFLPTQDHTSSRWRRIGVAYYENIILPPVTLYKVGDAYFVVDGNHRVSVARELGREFIDAEVMESQPRVPVATDIDAEELVELGERVHFLEVTRLDEIRPDVEITLTIEDGYNILLGHIEYHRYLQSKEWNREFDTVEAAAQWIDQVYLPVVSVIRESGMLEDFPGHTEGDLYLWVIEHQYYLREQFGEGVNTLDAVTSYANHFTRRFLKRLWNKIRKSGEK
nr:DUF4032 domain-containing protein [Anaerolineae bacterium]